MGKSKTEKSSGVTRRDALRLSAVAAGGLGAMSGARAGTHCPSPRPCYPDTTDNTETYSYFFKHLDK